MRRLRSVVLCLLAACGAEATHEECVALPTSECEVTPGCQWMRARPLRAVGDDFCLPADALAENVGCMGVSHGCDDVITLADDPSGRRWWFWDSCVPAGWTGSDASDAEPCF